jgi:predicted AlkP superfamily pyrophosphatase or phosphodiesterase
LAFGERGRAASEPVSARHQRLCHGLRWDADQRPDFRGPALRGSILLILGIVCVSCTTSCTTPTLRESGPLDSVLGQSARRGGGPPERVVLISVAGLDSSDFLNVWGDAASESDGVRMPNLARLAREGATGVRLHPPSPASSYASHATLATGRLPKSHGIVSDQTLDEEGKRSLPFWDNRLLKGTALWDAAVGQGVLSLGWPTTTGARIELMVPDGVPSDSSVDWLDFMRTQASPMLMREFEKIADAAISKNASTYGDGRDSTTWPTASEKDAAFAEVACQVAASDRNPGLWLIRLNQTASAQQAFGFGSVEVRQALGRMDDAIGRLIECLESTGKLAKTAIFVVGDVAYQPVHTRFDPNVILVRNGLVGRDPRSSTGVRSWLALSRSNGRSAYVYARDADSAIAARQLLEKEAAESGAFEVVSAAELAGEGGDPQAWFGLAAKPGFAIGNGLARPEMRPAEIRASAGAFPFLDGDASSVGFVAWGRGIRSQIRVPSVEQVDVAPTIAALLGLRLDSEIDGEAIVGVLRAAVPPPPPGPKRLGVGSDNDVERALRELGGGRELGQDK